MNKSIFYLMLFTGLMALGSCSTGNFVQDTGRFNYIKTDKQIQKSQPAPIAAIKEVRKKNPLKKPVISMALEAKTTAIKKSGKSVKQTNKAKVSLRNFATNSMMEEEELITKSFSENHSKTRSYINIPAPKNTTKEKSQLIALLLCVIFGMLGIHRFYLGKPLGGIIILGLTLIGIAYPSLLALAGLIVLIDAVRLLFGGLGPGW